MNDDQLLFAACVLAEESMADFIFGCNHHDCKKVKAMLKQLSAYRLKRWGKSKFEKIMENVVPRDITEIAKGPNRKFREGLTNG